MVYSADQIATARTGGHLLAEVLRQVREAVTPGVTTLALDQLAEAGIRQAGGEPSFLNYRGAGGVTPFPSTLCISINNEVVHGPATPGRTLQEGDIVGLDIGMRYPAKEGLCTDMAITVGVGSIAPAAERLIAVTREALAQGIGKACAGSRVRDISQAVQRHIETAGFSIVRDLVGHGVGASVHEDPEVPNFVVSGPIGDYRLVPGLIIAIEPMVNAGKPAVRILADGWTVATKDGSLSAHFEQTVVVGQNGAEILTPFL